MTFSSFWDQIWLLGSAYAPVLNCFLLIGLLLLFLYLWLSRRIQLSEKQEPSSLQPIQQSLSSTLVCTAKVFSPLVNLGLFFALLYLLTRHPVSYTAEWSASDLVVVLLTGIAVILAAVGGIIAIGAIVGYQTLHDHIGKTAVEATHNSFDLPSIRQQLQTAISAALDERAQQDVQNHIQPAPFLHESADEAEDDEDGDEEADETMGRGL